MTEATLFWHDYETFGTDPRRDRPAQFAGVRTDLNFNIVEDPVCIYCRPPEDYLPQPEACLVTGITPQIAAAQGRCEAEFAKLILKYVSQPNTCTLGYNSLRFDDEVTRNMLYRNLHDPYAREWQNGNSRWDLIDVVRAAYALRPAGINWPYTNEGRVSLRLEALTHANGIEHQGAHDALVDVYATINLAKLLKQAQPKLYDFLWQHRTKPQVLKLLQLGSWTPLLHVSGKYSTQQHCIAVVVPICPHPTDSNGVLVYDLSVDPEPLLTLTAAEIKQRIFTASADLPVGCVRIPLKTVHSNRCPVLAPLTVLRPEDAERLNIQLSDCRKHLQSIETAAGLQQKLFEVFTADAKQFETTDPDLAIYSGGFLGPGDKQFLQKVHASPPEQLKNLSFNFKDKRLAEMLFRYKARNYPEALTEQEQLVWRNHCQQQLTASTSGALTFSAYYAILESLKAGQQNAILDELYAYAKQKELALI